MAGPEREKHGFQWAMLTRVSLPALTLATVLGAGFLLADEADHDKNSDADRPPIPQVPADDTHKTFVDGAIFFNVEPILAAKDEGESLSKADLQTIHLVYVELARIALEHLNSTNHTKGNWIEERVERESIWSSKANQLIQNDVATEKLLKDLTVADLFAKALELEADPNSTLVSGWISSSKTPDIVSHIAKIALGHPKTDTEQLLFQIENYASEYSRTYRESLGSGAIPRNSQGRALAGDLLTPWVTALAKVGCVSAAPDQTELSKESGMVSSAALPPALFNLEQFLVNGALADLPEFTQARSERLPVQELREYATLATLQNMRSQGLESAAVTLASRLLLQPALRVDSEAKSSQSTYPHAAPGVIGAALGSIKWLDLEQAKSLSDTEVECTPALEFPFSRAMFEGVDPLVADVFLNRLLGIPELQEIVRESLQDPKTSESDRAREFHWMGARSLVTRDDALSFVQSESAILQAVGTWELGRWLLNYPPNRNSHDFIVLGGESSTHQQRWDLAELSSRNFEELSEVALDQSKSSIARVVALRCLKGKASEESLRGFYEKLLQAEDTSVAIEAALNITRPPFSTNGSRPFSAYAFDNSLAPEVQAIFANQAWVWEYRGPARQIFHALEKASEAEKAGLQANLDYALANAHSFAELVNADQTLSPFIQATAAIEAKDAALPESILRTDSAAFQGYRYNLSVLQINGVPIEELL